MKHEHEAWLSVRWRGGPPVGVGVGPGQLEGLSHDEPAEYLVKSVSVLRLTDDQIFQFGILTVSRVYQSLHFPIIYLPPSTQSFLV